MSDWDVRATGAGANVTWQVEASTPLEALREALEEAERTTVMGRREPPMPSRVEVLLTVREDGTYEGRPVVMLNMVDITGDVRQVHLAEEVAFDLIGDLAVGLRQLRRA